MLIFLHQIKKLLSSFFKFYFKAFVKICYIFAQVLFNIYIGKYFIVYKFVRGFSKTKISLIFKLKRIGIYLYQGCPEMLF